MDITVEVLKEVDVTEAWGVLNHPEVVKTSTADDTDMSVITPERVRDAGIIVIVGKFDKVIGAVWLVVPKGENVYDAHTNILPDFRGKVGMLATFKAINYVFTRTDAITITTNCPKCNPAAAMLANHMGMKLCYVKDKGFVKDGVDFASDVFYLPILEWAIKNGKIYEDNANKLNLPSIFGVCLEIFKYNPTKGAWLFNQLAPIYS